MFKSHDLLYTIYLRLAVRIAQFDVASWNSRALPSVTCQENTQETFFSHIIYIYILGMTCVLCVSRHCWAIELTWNEGLTSHFYINLIIYFITFSLECTYMRYAKLQLILELYKQINLTISKMLQPDEETY